MQDSQNEIVKNAPDKSLGINNGDLETSGGEIIETNQAMLQNEGCTSGGRLCQLDREKNSKNSYLPVSHHSKDDQSISNRPNATCKVRAVLNPKIEDGRKSINDTNGGGNSMLSMSNNCSNKGDKTHLVETSSSSSSSLSSQGSGFAHSQIVTDNSVNTSNAKNSSSHPISSKSQSSKGTSNASRNVNTSSDQNLKCAGDLSFSACVDPGSFLKRNNYEPNLYHKSLSATNNTSVLKGDVKTEQKIEARLLNVEEITNSGTLPVLPMIKSVGNSVSVPTHGFNYQTASLSHSKKFTLPATKSQQGNEAILSAKNAPPLTARNGEASSTQKYTALASIASPAAQLETVKSKADVHHSMRPRSNSVPNCTIHEAASNVRPPQTSSSLSNTDAVVGGSTIMTLSGNTTHPKAGQLRRGKWTVEEEAYVARVIQDFNMGYLNAPAGTTLRTYLSDKLNCDPMRITKKFTGDACIGKRVFHPAVRCANNTATIDKAQAELDALERRWRRRLEIQQRESAKKAAASAAAAAAGSGRHHLSAHLSHFPTSHQSSTLHASKKQLDQNAVVTQTASWLDRANAILSNKQNSSLNHGKSHSHTVQYLHETDVKKELQEVQRLIYEGPIIQRTSAGLPMLLESAATTSKKSPASTLGGCPVPKGGALMNDVAVATAASYVSLSKSDPPSKRKVSDDRLTTSLEPKLTFAGGQKSNAINTGQTSSPNGGNSDDIFFNNVGHQRELHVQESVSYSAESHHAQEKRLRKSLSVNHLPSNQFETSSPSSNGATFNGAAEDAATLLGFLTSVRASAASASSRSSK